MKGRLNVFQLGMLRWRDLHPYNAVHVARIPRPLDAPRLQAIIDTQMGALGLTGLELDAARGRYEYSGGPAHARLQVLGGEGAPQAIVCREIERQLNEPFAVDGRIDPFRFFAVDAGSSFHLGIAYDHFVAGGDSIVLLVKELITRYRGDVAADAPAPALSLYPPTFRRLVLRHPGRALRGMLRTFSSLASGRRAFRPRYPGGDHLTNGFNALCVDAQGAAALKSAAHAWGVTRNELLMAMVLQALVPLTEERRRSARRKELAIASIINLRAEFGAEAATAFGQFLSSFHVIHPMPPGIGLEPLARSIHVQATAVKSERRYYQSLLGIGAACLIATRMAPARRARFHGKSFPLWAGTTPLDVDLLWPAEGDAAPVPDYLRAVSTGPLMPLVVALTTANGCLHLGLSYRTAAFTQESIDNMATRIRASIQSLPA